MSQQVSGHINVALIFGAPPVRDDVRPGLALRPLHRTRELDPLARQLDEKYRKGGERLIEHPGPHHRPVPGRRRADRRHHLLGQPADSGAADFYAGGRTSRGFQNGLAIGGDYMSAASFLGISGAIALYGYDGFLYSIGFLVAWLVALLLVAEMLRNSGRYTMADQLAYRMKQRPVRTAAATSTVVVSIFYLLAQMVGAGALVALLLGVDSRDALKASPSSASAR